MVSGLIMIFWSSQPGLSWLFDEIEGLGPKAIPSQSAMLIMPPMPVAFGRTLSLSRGRSWSVPCRGILFWASLRVPDDYGNDLRRRKLRDQVPMTLSRLSHIGHLGLGGVGDSKGLMESVFRDKHIKWICNAKVNSGLETGKMLRHRT